MLAQLLALLQAYLDDKADLAAINGWIARNIWNSPEDVRDIIDQVMVELVYIADNVSDEEHFRRRMAEIVYPTVSLPMREKQSDAGATVTTGSASHDFRIRREYPLVTNLQVRHQFA